MRLFWYGALCAFAIGCIFGVFVPQAMRKSGTAPALREGVAALAHDSKPPNLQPQGRDAVATEPEGPEVDLAEAERQGLIRLEARGAGLASVLVQIQSKTPTPVRLAVEPGTVFDPIGWRNVQSMVVVRRDTITVPALSKAERGVGAACINMRLDVPASHHRLSRNPRRVTGELARLLAAPGFADERPEVRQFVIWTLTDNPRPGEYVSIVTESNFAPLMGSRTSMSPAIQSKISEWFVRLGIRTDRYAALGGDLAGSRADDWKGVLERLFDDNPTIRCQAMHALVRGPQLSDVVVAALENRLADEGEVNRGTGLYRESARDRDLPLRIGHVAAETLARRGHWRRLAAALASPNPAIRANGASGLAYAPIECEPALLARVRDTVPAVRAEVAWSLAEIVRRKQDSESSRGSPQAVEALSVLLADRESEVRHAVARQLVRAGLYRETPAARRMIGPAMEVLGRDQWLEAAQFLGRIRATEATARLASSARADDMELRRAAIDALGAIGTPAAAIALREISDVPTKDPARLVEQGSAKQWLEKIAKNRANPARPR